MLHILLTILKIIGIILLAILGILILLLCIVFFVPLYYEIQAETKGDLGTTKLDIKFYWLLHLLSGKMTYLEEELDYKIRILWKIISGSEESSVEESTSEEAVSEEISTEKKTEESKAKESDSEKLEQKAKEKPTVSEPEKEEQSQGKFEKIKCTIKQVCDKIKMVLEFLKGEPYILALGKVKTEVIALLVSLKPKKVNGKVRFGMEDPYQTGQILAALSVLYPFYGANIEIYPEFDQKIIEGNVYLKGHIRAIHAVKMALRIIIDKNVRTTIKDVKVLFEGN